ncbi:component of cytochrome b6f complex, partial [Tanacetum coccineum]
SFQSYRPNQKNILVIGPVPGQKYSEITFPILSPDPATKKDTYFLKYPIYVGGNRGRGQIYPDGSKSNNTVYNATASGIVSKILRKEKGGYEITIADASDGRQVVDIIPPGPELLVSEGESIKLDQPLTSNPNVGGFGQGDAEIVLQDPLRVQGLFTLGWHSLKIKGEVQTRKGLRWIPGAPRDEEGRRLLNPRAGKRQPGKLKHLSSQRKRKQKRFP